MHAVELQQLFPLFKNAQITHLGQGNVSTGLTFAEEIGLQSDVGQCRGGLGRKCLCAHRQ